MITKVTQLKDGIGFYLIISLFGIAVLLSFGVTGRGCGGDESAIEADFDESAGDEESDLEYDYSAEGVKSAKVEMGEQKNSLCSGAKNTIEAPILFSCSQEGINYIPNEDLYAKLPKDLLSPKPQIEGIENNCSEDVNLKRRPGPNLDRNLNYLSEWFPRAVDKNKVTAEEYTNHTHLVTNWNYNLMPFKDKKFKISKMELQIKDNSGEYCTTVIPCKGIFNMKFQKKMVDATMDLLITYKGKRAMQKISYGPFTVGDAWYVRPKDDIKKYGTEDGMSYANAFNGIEMLSLELEKINAGDTIFISGLHTFDYYNSLEKYTNGPSYLLLKSGESNSKQIIYRGDYPGDRGVVWGASRWVDGFEWENVATGVYKLSIYKYDLSATKEYLFEKVGVGGKLAHKVLAQALTYDALLANSGTYFWEEVNYLESKEKKNVAYNPYTKKYVLYVHLSDGTSPNGKIFGGHNGYQFFWPKKIYDENKKVHRFHNITFKNIVFLGQTVPEKSVRVSNLRWDGVKYAYSGNIFSPITFYYSNDHIDIVDSEMSCFGNGPYFINQEKYYENDPVKDVDGSELTPNDTLHYYSIKNLYAHHIGLRINNDNTDSHPIGLQGTNYGVIEDGIFVHVGSGPILWTSYTQDAKQNIFRRNFVRVAGSKLSGKECYGMNTDPTYGGGAKEGVKSGNVIENNIGEDCKNGFGANLADMIKISGNVMYNIGEYGLPIDRIQQEPKVVMGAKVTFMNNVLRATTPGFAHIRYKNAANSPLMIFDNNFYSDFSDYHIQFYFPPDPSFSTDPKQDGYDFKGWQENTYKCDGCLFDPNSKIISDSELFTKLKEKYAELKIPNELRRKEP